MVFDVVFEPMWLDHTATLRNKSPLLICICNAYHNIKKKIVSFPLGFLLLWAHISRFPGFNQERMDSQANDQCALLSRFLFQDPTALNSVAMQLPLKEPLLLGCNWQYTTVKNTAKNWISQAFLLGINS